MASKIKVDQLETADGSGTIALQNQLSGMTTASLPALGSAQMPAGSIIQVVHAEHFGFVTTTSTTFVSAMTGTITPSSTSSRIILMCCGQLLATNQTDAQIKFYRGAVGTTGVPSSGTLVNNFMSDNGDTVNVSYHWVDSPSTTSAITYTVGVKSSVSGQQVKFGNTTAKDSLILMEIAG
jgi:hypothetical protein